MPDTLRSSMFLRTVAMFVAVALTVSAASAQIYQGAVGGVSFDARGVVTRATVDDTAKLQEELSATLSPVASDLAAESTRRVVSLRGLESELTKAAQAGTPIPDEVRYLAGLRRIERVLADQERHDILLVGPAEGWKVDAKGNVVGLASE
ncbi:MAG: hypothetical protein Q4C47_00400, partial [Planctomycetia bacterium]|nr:hypothetical protein [Planctomycetia bacterium]